MLNCGDTFYAGDSEDDEPHLTIIVTPPEEGELVTVTVTTKRKRSETFVELTVGDHLYLKWDSVVSFAYARIRSVEDIETALKSGQAKPMDPIKPELLKKIRMGLRDSDFTPNGVRHYFKSLNIKD